MKLITESLQDFLNSLSAQAEKEIESHLTEVAQKAIEANKEKIVKEVSENHRHRVNTQIVSLMHSGGFEVQFQFKPKG